MTKKFCGENLENEFICVSGYSVNEGSRTFQVLSRKELEKIIDELDSSEIWERTYEKGEGYRFKSGTAYTYIDARTGEIHTRWLQRNQSLHPWDSFYEIWLCSMETGASWWDFNIPEDFLFDTTSEEYEEFLGFSGSAKEYIIEKYGEEELEERIQNCIDWYADEFRFDWENIKNQLDELYSHSVDE